MKKILSLFIVGFIFLLHQTHSKEIFPKNLYVYWAKNIEKAPFLMQICLEHLKMVCAAENWNFTLLTDKNLPEHIPDYEEKYQPVRTNGKHPDWQANVADLVRLAVLQQKGGMYLDLSTVLLRGLSWVETFQNYEYLLTNSELHKGQEPDIVLPYEYQYQITSEQRHPDHGFTNYEPGYGMWCFLSKANSVLIREFRNRHIYHYTHTKEHNEIQDVGNGVFFRGINGDYLDVQRSLYELIQEKQFELDKKLTLTGKRKNANNEYKVVGFRAQYGPFLFHYISPYKIFTHTVEQIYEEDYMPLFFMAKLTHYDRPYVEELFKRQIQLAKIYGDITQNFDRFMSSKPDIELCQNIKFIVNGSIIGELIKNNNVAKQYKLGSISVKQRQQWRDYCNKTFGIEADSINENDAGNSDLMSSDFPPIQADKKILQILNYLGSFLSIFLTDSMSLKLQQFFYNLATFSAESRRFYFGRPSGIQEAYYWRKVFEQRNPNVTNPTPNPNDQLAQTRPLTDYSTFQLIMLRLQLFLIANKSTHAFQLKAFLYLSLFTLKLVLLFIISAAVVKAIYGYIFAFNRKFNINGKNQSIFSLKKLVQLTDSSFSQFFQKIKKESIKLSKLKPNQKAVYFSSFVCNTVKYLLKKLLIAILCFSFIFYNVLIFSEYYFMVELGKIYYQEPYLISLIVVRIVYRKVFKRIGNNVWGFPGLTLEELLAISTPVYVYSIGASVIMMAERTQVRNLALAVSLSMILPVLIAKIQAKINELNKLYKLDKMVSKMQNLRWKIVTNLLFHLLLNLTFVLEISVIFFLGLSMTLPNLQFLVYKDQDYLLKIYFHKMQLLPTFFFLLLVTVLVVEVYFKNAKKQNCQLMKEFDQQIQSSEQNHNDEHMHDDFIFFEERNSTIVIRLKLIQRKFNQNKNRLETIFLGLYNCAKILFYFQLVFTEWPDILLRNIMRITYQNQLKWFENFTNGQNIVKVLFIFFVIFEFERLIEERLFAKKFLEDPCQQKTVEPKKKQKQNKSKNIFNEDRRKKNDYLRIFLGYLLLIEFLVLMIMQFVLMGKMLAYLIAIDVDNWGWKNEMESQFYRISSQYWLFAALSYKITIEMISNESKLKKHESSSEESEEISPMRQGMDTEAHMSLLNENSDEDNRNFLRSRDSSFEIASSDG